MAREHAQIKLSIWADEHWRELSPLARYLYMSLLTSTSLNYAGVADWRPSRLAPVIGMTVDEIEHYGSELVAELYLVIDDTTEEVLLRSFLRHDGLMKQPKMAVAMSRAFAGVSSSELRGVVVHELIRLQADFPSLSGWTEQQAQEMLTMTPIDPSTYPLGKGSIKGSGKGSVNPSGTPNSKGSVKGSPTPTPSPTPSPYSPQDHLSGDVTKPGSADAERDFKAFWEVYPRKVGKATAQKAYRSALKKPGVSAEVIMAGLKAQLPGPLAADPQFIPHPSTWLNRESWADEIPTTTPMPKYAPLKAQDYETAPSGMTLEESIAWQDAQLEKRRLPASGQ